MAGFNNSRAIATAVLMPSTAAPDAIYGPIGSIYINNNRFLHSYGTQNTFVGQNSGNFTLTIGSAIGNLGLGFGSLASLTTGGANTCVGESSGAAITTGANNTGLGTASLEILTTGTENTALGSGALELATTATFNTAVGSGALADVTTATSNTALGINAGTNYTTESSNLVLGNTGTVGDANWLRIGQQGNGLAQQNKCNIAGIYGVTPASPTIATVVIDNNGQLGTTPGGAPAISTITGNDGVPISPILGNINIVTQNSTVQFFGTAGTETLNFNRTTNLVLGSSLTSLTTGVNNVGVGVNVLNTLTSGQANVILGWHAGDALTTGGGNIAMGINSLGSATVSGSNIALGSSTLALAVNTDANIAIGAGSMTTYLGNGTTDGNIAIGRGSLDTLQFGTKNIVIGDDAASAYVNNESRNVIIGASVPGIAAENDVIRIGQNNTSGIQITNANNRFLHNFGTNNTFTGINAGNFTLSTAARNSGIGISSLAGLTTGSFNTAIGYQSGINLTTGASNTVLGYTALSGLSTGDNNIAIGAGSGGTYTTESNNVLINNLGTPGDANVIRIGTEGAGPSQQDRTFIAGIYGVTPALPAPELVIIDSAGQLGSTGGGVPTATVIVTMSQALASNTQYIIQAGAPVNLSLPATSLVGDVIRIIGDSNLWTITQAAGQQISYVGFDTTLGVGGSVASLQGSDCAELICVAANTRWTIFNGSANLNLV